MCVNCVRSRKLLRFLNRKSAALLVGQWAAPLLIMGLYNKIVKTEGHDRPESGTDKLNRII